ncbi:hypothetical protein IE077_001825, partial [Cardiosporidium cionae]
MECCNGKLVAIYGITFPVDECDITQANVECVDRLTRCEAAFRNSVVQSVYYDLVLWIKHGSSYNGEVEIKFKHTNSKAHGIFLDFSGGYIITLWINGKFIAADGVPYNADMSPSSTGGRAIWRSHRIGISSELLKETNTYESEVFVSFQNDYDNLGVGLCQIVDEIEQFEYFYSNCDRFEAHRLFPCFDQPGLKKHFRDCLKEAIKSCLRLTVVAPLDSIVLTNMSLVEQTIDAESSSLMNKNIDSSSHLGALPPSLLDSIASPDGFFLMVGPLLTLNSFELISETFNNEEDKEEISKAIPIHFHHRDKDTNWPHCSSRFLSFLNKGIRWYRQYLDRMFPFDKLDIVCLPLEDSSHKPK